MLSCGWCAMQDGGLISVGVEGGQAMEVYLEPYDDGTFDDYLEVYLEENCDSRMGREMQELVARHSIGAPYYLIRAIRRCGTGDHLGYCMVADTTSDDWEVGIYILARHRRMGVGRTALPLFLDEATAVGGKRELWARILVGNEASRRLFEGLGAILDRTEAIGGAEGSRIEADLAERGETVEPEELERLKQIEALVLGPRRKVWIYRIPWPRKG